MGKLDPKKVYQNFDDCMRERCNLWGGSVYTKMIFLGGNRFRLERCSFEAAMAEEPRVRRYQLFNDGRSHLKVVGD